MKIYQPNSRVIRGCLSEPLAVDAVMEYLQPSDDCERLIRQLFHSLDMDYPGGGSVGNPAEYMVTAVSVAPFGTATRRMLPDQISCFVNRNLRPFYARSSQPLHQMRWAQSVPKSAGSFFLYSRKQRARTVRNGQLPWAQVGSS